MSFDVLEVENESVGPLLTCEACDLLTSRAFLVGEVCLQEEKVLGIKGNPIPRAAVPVVTSGRPRHGNHAEMHGLARTRIW